MPNMSLVISKTSPLTNLAVIERLALVQTQLTRVAVPAAVWREMMALPHAGGRESLLAARDAGWLSVVAIAKTAVASSLRLTGLDEGESEAIALAVESSARLLLIDEKKGRRAARRLAVPVTGALGILAKGRKMGDIDSVKEAMVRLRAEAGFFISDEVEARILEVAGER